MAAAAGATPCGLRIQWHDGTGVLALDGELDLSSAQLLRDALAAVPPAVTVVVDMAGVTFADCAGMRPVLEAASARSPGAAVRLRHAPASAERILSLVGPVARLVVERPPD